MITFFESAEMHSQGSGFGFRALFYFEVSGLELRVDGFREGEKIGRYGNIVLPS